MRTQHLVTGMASICYNGSKLSTVNKGKSTGGEVQEQPGASFQKSLPSDVIQDMFDSLGNEFW